MKQILDPLADMLVQSYFDTAVYSRTFADDYGQPPTVMSKAQHLRSVVQALINRSDHFELSPAYSEFGRVEVAVRDSECRFLLQSQRALAIERATAALQLFDVTKYLKSDVLMLVYSFGEDSLGLSVAGTRRLAKSKHKLEAAGEPTPVGVWHYGSASQVSSFDQADVDVFSELGDLDIDEVDGS